MLSQTEQEHYTSKNVKNNVKLQLKFDNQTCRSRGGNNRIMTRGMLHESF
jgi:hypothetical protein